MSCPRRPPASGATFLGTNHRDPNWLRAERRGCSSARALLIVLAPLTEGGAFLRNRNPLQSQNSRDLLLVLVRFILIFLPGCTCPTSAGLSFSAQGEPNPGVPNCPPAEDGRPSARNVSECPSAPPLLRRGLCHHSGLNFLNPPRGCRPVGSPQ